MMEKGNVEYKSTKEKRFAEAYDTYADNVYRACLYLMKEKEKAEHVMEEVFIEFYDCFEEIPTKYWNAYLLHMVQERVAEEKAGDQM